MKKPDVEIAYYLEVIKSIYSFQVIKFFPSDYNFPEKQPLEQFGDKTKMFSVKRLKTKPENATVRSDGNDLRA